MFLGVRLGRGVCVAVECCGESCTLHAFRGADGSSKCGHLQQDRFAQTIRDQRRETYRVHYGDAVVISTMYAVMELFFSSTSFLL